MKTMIWLSGHKRLPILGIVDHGKSVTGPDELIDAYVAQGQAKYSDDVVIERTVDELIAIDDEIQTEQEDES